VNKSLSESTWRIIIVIAMRVRAKKIQDDNFITVKYIEYPEPWKLSSMGPQQHLLSGGLLSRAKLNCSS